jgi:hypothetical protein
MNLEPRPNPIEIFMREMKEAVANLLLQHALLPPGHAPLKKVSRAELLKADEYLAEETQCFGVTVRWL